MKRNTILFFSIVILCFLSNFSNATSVVKQSPFYSLLYPQVYIYNGKNVASKMVIDPITSVTATYNINPDALVYEEGGVFQGGIEIDNADFFCDTPGPAGNSGTIPVTVPSSLTYTLTIDGGLNPGVTCQISTDAGTYYGTVNNSGFLEVDNIVVNTSMNINIYY